MIGIRRKGIAIVYTTEGILIVAGKNKRFILPGGGANSGESRKKAAIRELYEETGLKTKSIKYLFSYTGNKWRTNKNKIIRNHTKVFFVKTYGRARPRHEIIYIAFWKPSSKTNLSSGTRKIIEKYLKYYTTN